MPNPLHIAYIVSATTLDITPVTWVRDLKDVPRLTCQRNASVASEWVLVIQPCFNAHVDGGVTLYHTTTGQWENVTDATTTPIRFMGWKKAHRQHRIREAMKECRRREMELAERERIAARQSRQDTDYNAYAGWTRHTLG